MKLYYVWIVFFLIPVFNRALSPATKLPWDSFPCLEIEGKVLNAWAENLEVCKVELLYYNKVVESQTLKKGKRKFKFYLHKNARYAIRISKEGYLSRLVCIDTNVPVNPSGLCRFSFTTRLLKIQTAKSLNRDVADFPIALIYYNERRGYFYYHKKYTQDMKRALAAFNYTTSNGE